MQKVCIQCNRVFETRRKEAKYHNHDCYAKSKVGNVPPNSGQFKKGETSYWKGRKRPEIQKWMGEFSYKKDNKPWNKGLLYSNKKRVELLQKGEYKYLHLKVNNRFGRYKFCESCGSEDKSRYHWANISGKYTEDREDWMRLCVSCHTKYDRAQKKGSKLYKRKSRISG